MTGRTFGIPSPFAGGDHSGAIDTATVAAGDRVLTERLRSAAMHDHPTGAPDRLPLEDRLIPPGQRVNREPGYRFGVLLLDLDGFTAVNDTLRHAAGDQLSVPGAGRLTRRLRRTDTVARLGGDEFVVLIDDGSGPGADQMVRDSIRAAVTAPCLIDGKSVEVGRSIGSAISGDGTVDPGWLLRESDAAGSEAKSASRRR